MYLLVPLIAIIVIALAVVFTPLLAAIVLLAAVVIFAAKTFGGSAVDAESAPSQQDATAVGRRAVAQRREKENSDEPSAGIWGETWPEERREHPW